MIPPAFFSRPQRAIARAHAGRMQAARRLATGLRVERASDGPAELAMATRARARSRSERMARRNAGTALDAYKIADGGLSEIGGVLVRMRELAVQAAHGVLGDREREFLDSELGELVQGIDQLARQSKLGDLSLLVKNTVDVGFLVDSSSSMNPMINQLKASVSAFAADFAARGLDVEMGLAELNRSRDFADGVRRLADIGDGTFDAQLTGLTTTGGAMDPATGIAEVIGETDVVGSHEPDAFTWRDGSNRMVIYLTDTGREAVLTPTTEQEAGEAAADRTVRVHIIGEHSNDDRDGLPGSDLDEIASLSGGGYFDRGGSGGDQIANALSQIAATVESAAAKSEIVVQVGADADDRIVTDFPFDARASALGVADLSLRTEDDARAALAEIDTAIERVSSMRAESGSMMNRLEIVRRQLSVSEETTEAAASRMVDADVAVEASQMVRSEILASAAAGVLAQAMDIARQSVLGLLG